MPAHARAGPRIHADDTPVPVLAKGKTRTGRLWTVVRDDRPFGCADPPAAAYFYSPDRGGEHPRAFLEDFAGIMQADAFSGFGQLYAPGREAGTIVEAACWAHGRRKFFELARRGAARAGGQASAGLRARERPVLATGIQGGRLPANRRLDQNGDPCRRPSR